MAPNGNGGCLTSLSNLNLISKMKSDGISHVQIIGVDNVLAKIGDPYFLGYAESKGYDVTGKYVPKVSEYSSQPDRITELIPLCFL